MAENGAPPGAPQVIPIIATMKIVFYADGNLAYEAPLSNLPVCFTMVGLMQAELAGLQWQRTRRQGGLVVEGTGDVPLRGPGGGG